MTHSLCLKLLPKSNRKPLCPAHLPGTGGSNYHQWNKCGKAPECYFLGRFHAAGFRKSGIVGNDSAECRSQCHRNTHECRNRSRNLGSFGFRDICDDTLTDKTPGHSKTCTHHYGKYADCPEWSNRHHKYPVSYTHLTLPTICSV